MIVRIIKENKWFLLPYLVLLLLVLPLILLTDKGDLHLWLNGYHNQISDIFFKYITWAGDGLFICAVCFIFLFISYRHSLLLFSSYILTGLVTQIFKRLVFADIIRPVQYYKDTAELHLVEGVTMLGSRSFPSGHATSAFALFLCLAMISGNKWIKLTCAILAFLVSYSRVYLSQHFLTDIYAGSLIGSLGALGIYMVLFRFDRSWHDRNIISLFSKK